MRMVRYLTAIVAAIVFSIAIGITPVQAASGYMWTGHVRCGGVVDVQAQYRIYNAPTNSKKLTGWAYSTSGQVVDFVNMMESSYIPGVNFTPYATSQVRTGLEGFYPWIPSYYEGTAYMYFRWNAGQSNCAVAIRF